MKNLMIGATVIALLTGQLASAQPGNQRDHRRDGAQHGDQWHNGQWHDQSGRRDSGRHRGWSKDRGHNYHWGRGQRMGYNDWRYAQRIDYRRYNLRQPPRGYEWRRNDDRFLLVAVATGLIAAVILTSGR